MTKIVTIVVSFGDIKACVCQCGLGIITLTFVIYH